MMMKMLMMKMLMMKNSACVYSAKGGAVRPCWLAYSGGAEAERAKVAVHDPPAGFEPRQGAAPPLRRRHPIEHGALREVAKVVRRGGVGEGEPGAVQPADRRGAVLQEHEVRRPRVATAGVATTWCHQRRRQHGSSHAAEPQAHGGAAACCGACCVPSA